MALAWLASAASSAAGLEYVTIRTETGTIDVVGQLVVEAQDGGLLLESRDGALWSVPPEELVERRSDDVPFTPLSQAELAEQLLAELPPGFEVYTTQHYLICHNTSRAYAQWCGALFERLYLAFNNYWSRRGFELHEPRFPLVAMVFADKGSYVAFAQSEVGEAVGSIIGYYSLRSNRMITYDLTGIQALRGANDRRGSSAQINQMLARPEAERTVATIIHEATHQIAFNCGLHTRYADIPLWFSEGIAIYFETPDLKSTTGWRNLGSVNQVRLAGFRDYLRRREANSLESLLANDDRLRHPRTAGDAYAEAWALNYFLIRHKPEQFKQYVDKLSQKKPLLWDEPDTRLQEFRDAFGSDLKALDAEFLRYMSRVR